MNDSFSSHENFSTLELRGQGKVTAVPDVAVIRLGVLTTGENLSSIQSENAMLVQSIIQILEEMGISDISTFQYVIEKNFVYEDGTRIDKGYNVRNILEIKVYDMEQVGTVIDAAVEYGANIVDFISFQVSDPSLYYQEALNLAIMDGIDKARTIAGNLGININLIPVRIIENPTHLQPPIPFYAIREGDAATPIQPGDTEIIANVTLKFIY